MPRVVLVVPVGEAMGEGRPDLALLFKKCCPFFTCTEPRDLGLYSALCLGNPEPREVGVATSEVLLANVVLFGDCLEMSICAFATYFDLTGLFLGGEAYLGGARGTIFMFKKSLS